jgi:type IV pilus assembly protein PilP
MIVKSSGLPLLAAFTVTLFGCSDDPPPPAATPAEAAPEAAAPTPGANAGEESDEAGEALPPSGPIDFTEVTRMRDPFMSYAAEFAVEARKRIKSQREVVLDQYALDELKLSALVTGIRPPLAMLIDPAKTGHVVQEGQFVGRSEVVHGGTSGAEYEINWRVDRIRDTDIVFVREDPANPDVPTATRVIPLRPDDVLAVR